MRAALLAVALAAGTGAAVAEPRPSAFTHPSGTTSAAGRPAGAWFEIVVPGGIAGLARAADLDPATPPWRLLPDLTRRLHASFGERTAARVSSQVAAFLADFARPRRVRSPSDVAPPTTSARSSKDLTPEPSGNGDDGSLVLVVPAGPSAAAPPSIPVPPAQEDGTGARGSTALRVPMPLTPAAWDRILGRDRDGRPRDVLAAVAVDGGAARLYRGLIALDAPTLAALASDPDVLREIYRRHSDAFGTFAPGFRVEGGRVAVPGGHGEAGLWQALVGVSVMRPSDFLLRLASADAGHLFFFYDTMQRLDDAHRRFALAAAEGDTGRRAERVRALKAVFAADDPWWDLSRLPFSRKVADAPRVLSTARVTSDGILAAPHQQVLWAAAFEDQVDAPAAWRARLALSPPADAAWLVERIAAVDSNVGRSRLGMLAFAQRVFGGRPDADPADLLAALRGFGRYRALALALERMAIHDPALHAAAARHAEQIQQAGHGDRGRAALAEFQGAVALVERAHFSAVLDPAAAGELVRSLSGVRVEDGRDDDRVATWIEQALVPALRSRLRAPRSASAETIVLRAMAGHAEATRAPRLEWEGLTYDVDPAAAEFARLRAVRRRQGGATLDQALAARGDGQESRLGAVLTDIVYASALGRAEGAPAASEDVARRHDFGFAEPEILGGPLPEWGVPREVAGPGQRWHARGALLGLDVGLARLALRRLEADVPPVPRLSAADRRAFAEGAVVVRTAALDDAGRDTIAAALRRGRERLARAADDPGALERITAELRLRDWRRGTVPWIATHDPEHLESAFTLAEVLWLGSPEAGREAGAWGTSARWDDGCLCARLPPPPPLDELAGRTADGRLAALSPDLHLRTAELLSEMQLPSRLLPAVLSLALQDLMDGADPAYLDDALAVSRFARALGRARMEDYVAALVGRGPLVPPAHP